MLRLQPEKKMQTNKNFRSITKTVIPPNTLSAHKVPAQNKTKQGTTWQAQTSNPKQAAESILIATLLEGEKWKKLQKLAGWSLAKATSRKSGLSVPTSWHLAKRFICFIFEKGWNRVTPEKYSLLLLFLWLVFRRIVAVYVRIAAPTHTATLTLPVLLSLLCWLEEHVTGRTFHRCFHHL